MSDDRDRGGEAVEHLGEGERERDIKIFFGDEPER